MIKLTQKQIEDLLTLINHAEKDISYGWGSSYGGYDEEDKQEIADHKKAVKKSERAIKVIKKIILMQNLV